MSIRLGRIAAKRRIIERMQAERGDRRELKRDRELIQSEMDAAIQSPDYRGSTVDPTSQLEWEPFQWEGDSY